MAIESNAAQVGARLRARAARVQAELATAAKQIALTVHADAKALTQSEIYNVPIPAGADGKPAWRRTGNLKRSEGQKTDRTTAILTNNANYSVERYYMGTPQGRAIRSPGVRSIQWQRKAALARRNYVLETRRKAVLRALSL